MAATASAKRPSHSSEWSPVSIATKTETPSPIFSGSTTATRFWITPSASSFWMRFQHGVEDNPTRLPTSATESEASSCRTARIFRSMASMLPTLDFLGELVCVSNIWEKYFLFQGHLCSYREEY